MKTHFSNPKSTNFVIRFLATFELGCDSNKIYEEAAMWALPLEMKDDYANALNGSSCSKHRLALIATFVQNEQRLYYKLLRSYSELVVYFHKKYSTNHTITSYNATLLQYMQTSGFALQQYADDRNAMSCKLAKVYDKSKVKFVFIEEVDHLSRYGFRHFCATETQANSNDSAFQLKYLLSIQK